MLGSRNIARCCQSGLGTDPDYEHSLFILASSNATDGMIGHKFDCVCPKCGKTHIHKGGFPKGYKPWNTGLSKADDPRMVALSQTTKARWDRGEFIIKNKQTAPERNAEESLSNRGIEFHSNERIENLVAPDQVIYDYTSIKIAVFEDGCYYHGCLNQDCRGGRRNSERGDYNVRGRPISKTRERDKYVTERLIVLGWIVIRVWEHDFKQNKDVVGLVIDDILNKNVG